MFQMNHQLWEAFVCAVLCRYIFYLLGLHIQLLFVDFFSLILNSLLFVILLLLNVHANMQYYNLNCFACTFCFCILVFVWSIWSNVNSNAFSNLFLLFVFMFSCVFFSEWLGYLRLVWETPNSPFLAIVIRSQ